MLRNLIIRWFINSVALGIAGFIFSGIRFVQLSDLLLAAAIFGVLNAVIKSILVIFTLPINILTLGLFTFIINAFMLGLTAALMQGFIITGFWPALGGAIIVTIVSILLNIMLTEPDKRA